MKARFLALVIAAVLGCDNGKSVPREPAIETCVSIRHAEMNPHVFYQCAPYPTRQQGYPLPP